MNEDYLAQLDSSRDWKDLNEENRTRLQEASKEESAPGLRDRIRVILNEGRQNHFYEAKNIETVLAKLEERAIDPEHYRVHLFSMPIIKWPVTVYSQVTINATVIGRPIFVSNHQGEIEHNNYIRLFDDPLQTGPGQVSQDKIQRDREGYLKEKDKFSKPHLKAYLNGVFPPGTKPKFPVHKFMEIEEMASNCIEIEKPVLVYEIPKIKKHARGPENIGNFYLVGYAGARAAWNSEEEIAFQIKELKR